MANSRALGRLAWRYYASDGVPSSGPNKPRKRDILDYVDMVGAEIDDLDERVTDIEDGQIPVGAISRQVLGKPTTPATGSNASAGHVVDSTPFSGDGIVRIIWIYSGTSATVTFGIWQNTATDTYTRTSRTIDLSVTSGLHSYTIDIEFYEGEYAGFSSSTAGWVTSTGTYTGGYYYEALGSPPDSEVVDASATSPNTLQYQIICDVNSEFEEAEFFITAVTSQKIIGLDDTLATGSNSGAGHFIFEAVTGNAIVREISIWATVAGWVTPGAYTKEGSVWTRERAFPSFYAAVGLNTFSRSDIMYRGEWLGFQGLANGWASFQSGGRTPVYIGGSLDGNEQVTIVNPTQLYNINVKATLRVYDSEDGKLHTVTQANSDKVISVEQSFGPGTYQPKGKNWPNVASQESDYVWDIYAIGGTTVSEMLGYLRERLVGYGVTYLDSRPTITIIKYGKNDFIDGVSIADFRDDLRELIMLCQSCGIHVVVCSELDAIYGAGGDLIIRQLCNQMGVTFLSMVAHRKEVVTTPVYDGFFQAPSNVGVAASGWHPGARSNYLITDPILLVIENFGRPRQSLKMYRKRDSVSPASVADLLFVDDYTRNQIWKEVRGGNIHFADAHVGYVDLVNETGSYASNVVVESSERFALSNGTALSFGSYALVRIIINGTAENVDWIDVTFSNDFTVYALDTASAVQWTALDVDNGTIHLTADDLAGKLIGDELYLLVHDGGGVTMSEPLVQWRGEPGKPAQIPSRPVAKGSELLTATTVYSGGSIPVAWTAGGGASASTTPTFKLPPGYTGIVELTTTKTLTQALTFSPSTSANREILIHIKAGRWPPIRTTHDSADPLYISEDTYDSGRVVVTLIDGDAQEYTFYARVGLWWKWVEIPAHIPMDVSSLSVKIAGDGPYIYIAAASVKFIDA